MSNLEEINNVLQDHERRIKELESVLKKHSIQEMSETKEMPQDLMNLIVKNLNKTKLWKLAILSLKYHGALTIEQQTALLKKWGKNEVNSLQKNYKRDMVEKGFSHIVRQDGNESTYSLTEKGKVEAENIIKELESE